MLTLALEVVLLIKEIKIVVNVKFYALLSQHVHLHINQVPATNAICFLKTLPLLIVILAVRTAISSLNK